MKNMELMAALALVLLLPYIKLSMSYSCSVRNKLFLWVASTCYLVFKVVAKLTYLVAIIGGHVTALLPPIVRFMTEQNSVWSKTLIMPLTLWNFVLS